MKLFFIIFPILLFAGCEKQQPKQYEPEIYMQSNGIEIYRIETGNTEIYLSNTGYFEL